MHVESSEFSAGGVEFGDHAGDDRLFRDPEDDLVRQALREWSHGGD